MRDNAELVQRIIDGETSADRYSGQQQFELQDDKMNRRISR